MRFKIEIMDSANKDLRNIFFYICEDLQSPKTAKEVLNKLLKMIISLQQLPERYRRYECEPWYSAGFRIFSIDNYNILYIPNLEKYVVTVMAIVYSKRDINEHLRKI